MKNTLLAMLLLCSSLLKAQIGAFEKNIDINNPKLKGSSSYEAATQTYTMTGSGINMWANSDQLQFLYKKIKGDFIIQATIKFEGAGTDPHRKIGIIAREELTGGSRYVDACVHGDDLTSLQFRDKTDDKTDQIVLSVYHPTEIQLERSGNTFIFSAAVFGSSYKEVRKELALNEEVFAGLFVCSHNPDIIEKAYFSNVKVIIPVAKNFQPYRDYIGSHVEVMDVFTGNRQIVHSAPNSLQAPNWTVDDKSLLFNSSDGLMHKFDFATKEVSKLNTGTVTQNNNDHVLSFDGKQIALSHYVGEKRTSTLFIMPIGGSDNPTQISDPSKGHSFLHGFSPDAKKLIFTGYRNNIWDIYTIDIATKEEKRLTNTPSLDDSPEYTPDGKWIYFNSIRTGSMKLWRMKPDGSNQEQVTFDEYNDWFPHISPDGKWMVYLSFMPDIDPTQHPFYRTVYLKLMPISGGIPKTIAYIYGGQGTINTPSWSPDSKKVSFVSNSKL